MKSSKKGKRIKQYFVGERKRIVDAYENSSEGIKKFCQQHHIAQGSLYEWRKRFKKYGLKGLENKPNNPSSPKGKKYQAVKEAILEVKTKKPGFGIRKIRDFLARLK